MILSSIFIVLMFASTIVLTINLHRFLKSSDDFLEKFFYFIRSLFFQRIIIILNGIYTTNTLSLILELGLLSYLTYLNIPQLMFESKFKFDKIRTAILFHNIHWRNK